MNDTMSMVLVFGSSFFLFAAKMGRRVSVRQVARKAVLSYTVIGVYVPGVYVIAVSHNCRISMLC